VSTAPASSAEAVCPYCRAGFEPDEEIHPCPACGTPHHADCFAENRGCTIFGCTAAPADDPRITLTPTNLQPSTPGPASPFATSSIYNFRQPYTPQLPQASVPPQLPIPPPPMPAGSVPPPPFAGTPAAYPLGYGAFQQPYPSYTYGDIRPKSRVTFVLLAVFLGSFGVHNFYTGYTKKAAIQLCLSILTCFWATPITWIWAIVEACTITADDDGVPLT
jgi:hypothetical protein